MTRTMYDSVNPSAIPTTAAMVAGYVDGRFAWSAAGWARFPNAVKVRIAVFPSTNDGHVLDCETGDATPAQCPAWVRMRRAAGVDPTVYCAQSQWATVQAAFTAAGVPQPHYWVASYPGTGAGTVPVGAVAHQYADSATSGGDWDLSAVLDYWPGVDAGPSPSVTTPHEDDTMIIECDQVGQQGILSGGILTPLDVDSATAIDRNTFPRVYVTAPVWNQLLASSNALSGLAAQIDALPAAIAKASAAAPAAGGGLTDAQVVADVKSALAGETGQITFGA